jgi:hypothetical protein
VANKAARAVAPTEAPGSRVHPASVAGSFEPVRDATRVCTCAPERSAGPAAMPPHPGPMLAIGSTGEGPARDPYFLSRPARDGQAAVEKGR